MLSPFGLSVRVNTSVLSQGLVIGLPASEAPESLENNESSVEMTEPSLDWRSMAKGKS